MISSKTSFIALIGNPVSHSFSPIMQNAALQYLGLDLIYIAIPCNDEDLSLVLNSLKKINCKGLNITIPYKEKVFNLCNEISPVASKLKAINTLKLNSEKEWSATNTDVDGFIYPLKNLNFDNQHLTIKNDLQLIVENNNDSVKQALYLLSKLENSLTFSMSGSGPTCFALFKDVETAKKELTANYKLFRNKGYDSWVCTFLEKGITFI